MAFLGLLTITAIIIYLLRKKQKVCFKSRQTRFPCRSTNSSAPYKARTLSSHEDYVTSINNHRLHSLHDTEINNDVESVDSSGQRTVSKHFITDGKERSVHFNYKVTLHKCDSDGDIGKLAKDSKNEGFIL